MSEPTRQAWYRQRSHVLTGFILHCLSGVIAVAVHYGIMFAALQLGLAPLTSTSLGFAGGALTRFLMAYYHIFTPSDAMHIAAVKFALVLGLQFLANGALFAALTGAGLPVWPAQVLATGLLTVGNYLAYRYWVFR